MKKLNLLINAFALLFLLQSCKKENNSFLNNNSNSQISSANSPTITDSNLLCYYPFQQNLKDQSGHKNNGILHGTISYVADRFGNPGKAISFANSNAYIEIPEDSFVGLTKATIALEFYVTSSS